MENRYYYKLVAIKMWIDPDRWVKPNGLIIKCYTEEEVKCWKEKCGEIWERC